MLPISVVSIFCEDIREEKVGTEILLGIFPDNVRMPAIPGNFRKIAIYTRVHLDPNSDTGPFSIKLRLANRQELPLGEIGTDLIEQAKTDARKGNFPVAGLISRAVLGPFHVQEAGTISVIVKSASGEE